MVSSTLSLLTLICIMHACTATRGVESVTTVNVIVKLPANLESVEKLANMLDEFSRDGLKVECTAEFELKAQGDAGQNFAALSRVAELTRRLKRHGIASAISVSLDELPKLVNERPPNCVLAVTLRASESPSPFAPQTMQACAKALKLLSNHFANQVSMVTIHVPQLETPTLGALRASEATQYDFWCGDNHARLSFMHHIKARYLVLDKLNRAWGTKFALWGEINYPMERSSEDWTNSPSGVRRHWLDFIGWYALENAQFVSQLLRHMREVFVQEKLCTAMPTVATPFSSWLITLLARAISADGNSLLRVGANTPLLNSAVLLSSCEHYGVDRICDLRFDDMAKGRRSSAFLDGSSSIGFQAFTSALLQPKMLATSLDDLPKLLRMMSKGEFVIPRRRHQTDIAVLIPSVSLAIEPSLQDALAKCMMSIYDAFPCDLIDEHLLCDGAIENYRVLIVPLGSMFSCSSLERILSWVERGGVLLVGSESVWTDVSGSSAIGERLLANSIHVDAEILKRLSTSLSDSIQIARVPSGVLKEAYTALAKPVGDGVVIWLPTAAVGERGFALVAADVAFNISGHAPATRRAVSPFNMWRGLANSSAVDGVIALWHGDFVVLLNASMSAVAVLVQTEFGEVRCKLSPYEFSLFAVRGNEALR